MFRQNLDNFEAKLNLILCKMCVCCKRLRFNLVLKVICVVEYLTKDN